MKVAYVNKFLGSHTIEMYIDDFSSIIAHTWCGVFLQLVGAISHYHYLFSCKLNVNINIQLFSLIFHPSLVFYFGKIDWYDYRWNHNVLVLIFQTMWCHKPFTCIFFSNQVSCSNVNLAISYVKVPVAIYCAV